MATQIQSVGEGAVAVQFQGNGNIVRIVRGDAALALNRLHLRKREPNTLIELLRTDVRATTFVGRGNLCRQLAEWRAKPESISVQCITGPAGAGKTRLAIETCEAAEADGWVAAFVSRTELARFHATQNLVHWILPKDALIVVDYAATSLAVLKSWFSFLAQERNRLGGGKLRILLLERQADPESGWWSDLMRRDSLDRAVPADLVGRDALIALPPLDAETERRALLTQALRLAAPLFDPPVAVHELPSPGENKSFDARLADARIDNEPLYLLMAGVHAARHGAPAALELDRAKLADEMAAIEAARLEKFAEARGFTDDGKFLKHLVACLTLQNGCKLNKLTDLIREEERSLDFNAPFDVEGVAARLCDCLPSSGGMIDPIRPDLIGEAFLLLVIKGGKFRREDACRAIVLRAYHRSESGVVDTLVRCAQDLARGHSDHDAVLWLRELVAASADLHELQHITDSLPRDTLSMRELGLDATQRIVAIVRSRTERHDDTALTLLAGWLNDLGVRLQYLGRYEEAFEAAQEAVQLYRSLAEGRPGAFTLELAGSLHNLSDRLKILGRPEEALTVAQEAVQLFRELAATQPDASIPDLAPALHCLANRLSALGRPEEALEAAQEAVQLYRELAATQPEVFAPGLGGCLDNLANRLSALGRSEEALEAAQEAVQLYRELGATHPDAWTANLAALLDNLANHLGDVGRVKEALDATWEAVELYRELVAAWPDVFNPDLAMSLNNLAIRLSDLERHEDALEAAQEAVQLYRSLVDARPDTFAPDLARSLSVLGKVLEALERIAEAVTNVEEALRLLVPHFQSQQAPALVGVIFPYLQDYIRRCLRAGREPDVELLSQVNRVRKGTSPTKL